MITPTESVVPGLSPAALSPAELALLQAHWDAFAPSAPSPHVANNFMIRGWREHGRPGLLVEPRYNYTPSGEVEFVPYREVPDLTPRRYPLFPGGPLTYGSRNAVDVTALIAAVERVRARLGALPVQYNGPSAEVPDAWYRYVIGPAEWRT